MLSILFNWLYAAGTFLCLGVGFAALIEKYFHYRLKRLDSLLVSGMVIATVYAQFFSLITKVGLLANVILVVVCVVAVVACGSSLKKYVQGGWQESSIARRIVTVVLVLLWAYFTSRGYMHYDSDLYHAQSIRWIEEYGVVPGLGNLHERFAYNSSFFALSALYSMKFLLGQSLHAMSGFFALVLSVTILDIGASFKRRRFILGDYARIGAIYYLITIIDEVVSPATDYSIMCVVFFIVIKWLDALAGEAGATAEGTAIATAKGRAAAGTATETGAASAATKGRAVEADAAGKASIVPYALLCVLGVYALTLKLTAGLILILLIKPAYLLIKEKRVKEIFLYLGMGLLVAIPWFVRTVVISGWLLYPFPALDLFSVDWKMDAELIAIDAAQISAWGKALYNIALLDTPLWVWISNWFQTTLSGMEKLLILGNACCILLFVAGIIWMVVCKKWQHLDMALVLAAMICSYGFWQLNAPLMRYGYAYVLLTDFLTVGWILSRMGIKPLEKLVYFVLLAYGIYKAFTIGEYLAGNYLQEYYIWQQDYNVYALESYEIQGQTFYKPVSGDRTGYEAFPAAPTQADIELRGEGMEDGFRRKGF